MVNVFSNTINAISARGELATYMHPDYIYYHPEWVAIRDAIAGERRIKEKGAAYLPPLDSEYGTTYETYKERAVFVNMVARTVLGLVGTIFRRPAKVEGVNKDALKAVTLSGLDFNLFAKKLALEICAIGRMGVLVDMHGDKAYLTEYVAENILSWKTTVVDGKEKLSYVLLREIVNETPVLGRDLAPSTAGGINPGGNLSTRYRVLILDGGIYKQRVYTVLGSEGNPSFVGREYTEVIPTRNGTPFNFIPMVVFGPLSPTPEVQKSPVFDIVTLNIAHYRTSAQLEHGRFYTALPVYYVPVSPNTESAEYHVGPSVVWEVASGERPGILEYYGTGLGSLTTSLTEKEEHIAQLGGRIMGIRPQATAESDNIFRMKQANEMSILLNITESLSLGLTQILTWYLEWQRVSFKDLKVKLNQDFKALQIAARELRALALLYQEGILPVQAVYESLQAAEFIPEDWTLEDFLALLKNTDNFPNQPDVEAKAEGYPNAQAKVSDEAALRRETALLEEAEAGRKHSEDLQEQMFEQGKETARFEHELTVKLEAEKSKNKIREQKAAPKKPATPPKSGQKPAR